MVNPFSIQKGSRIHVSGFISKPLGTYSIAGAQLKFVGDMVDVRGTVAHVRGDDPIAPKQVGVWVNPDDGYEGATDPCEKCGVPHAGPFDIALVREINGTAVPGRVTGVESATPKVG